MRCAPGLGVPRGSAAGGFGRTGRQQSSLEAECGTKVASRIGLFALLCRWSRACTGGLRRGRAARPSASAGSARTTMSASGFGLFDPALEKDSCGVGFIADIKGRKSHQIVEDALTILLNLEHRGAVGADPRAGDGAGILVQTPHKFFAKKAAELGFALPAPGHY